MSGTTVEAVNRRLQQEFGDLRLRKGIGGWYFTGDVAQKWFKKRVAVADLSAYSLEQWVEIARRAVVNGTTE